MPGPNVSSACFKAPPISEILPGRLLLPVRLLCSAASEDALRTWFLLSKSAISLFNWAILFAEFASFNPCSLLNKSNAISLLALFVTSSAPICFWNEAKLGSNFDNARLSTPIPPVKATIGKLANKLTIGLNTVFIKLSIVVPRSRTAADSLLYGLISSCSAIDPNFFSPSSVTAFKKAWLFSVLVKELTVLPFASA